MAFSLVRIPTHVSLVPEALRMRPRSLPLSAQVGF